MPSGILPDFQSEGFCRSLNSLRDAERGYRLLVKFLRLSFSSVLTTPKTVSFAAMESIWHVFTVRLTGTH